jgi:hypothetical protein
MRSLILAVAAVCLSACCCQSREEKLKSAEDEGNMLIAMKAKLLKGAGEAVKKEGKEAAQTLAEGTGEVVKGLGTGIEKGLMEVKFTLHESVAANGLGLSRAARGEQGTAQHTVTAYITFDKAFAGAIELRAYDAENREVGRSRMEADEKESAAKYIDFAFDQRTPLMTAGHFEMRAFPTPKP